ncbi:MAG: 16S rRNA (guanine(527)-N(7))-methyltransferase RsmG [Lachnospiraceae bacterium]|nr:16S rRNA (guanine(527)-N(7))-methyltransferase RsmG [Lachnospiraceae bacterium]
MNNKNILTNVLSQLNISLTDKQTDKFMLFYDMLIESNKVMNLTGITEFDEVVLKHFADSLSLVKIYDLSSSKDIKIIDIGTGAGFPGIPLKIAYPEINITLLDSLGKRINFLNSVILKLGLNDSGSCLTVNMRAEDYVKESCVRESYDLAVTRAVSDLSVICEYALPYIKTGGSFIPYKSGDVEEEIKRAENAIDILGGIMDKTISFDLPGSDIKRSLIEIKKTRPTPDKYPRKAGLPVKKPLK